MTCAHVIKDSDKVSVILNEKSKVRKVDASIVGYDETTDIAVLKISGSGLPYLQFADPDR